MYFLHIPPKKKYTQKECSNDHIIRSKSAKITRFHYVIEKYIGYESEIGLPNP